MPPRKSNVSVATNPDDGTPTKEPPVGINIEDLSLPRTMVQRLAKGVLPPNTQIHKDAILAMQKGATVFINYLAGAAEAQLAYNRRTIPPTAVLEALQELEFEGFVGRVEAELKRFNEVQTGKRNEYRRKVKEGKKEGLGEMERGDEEGGGGGGGDDGEGGEGRAVKRVRREIGGEERGVEGHGAGEMSVMDDEEAREQVNEEEVEEEEEEEEEVEEEVEEDEQGGEGDEDEYPDEGRRLGSLDPEADEVEMASVGSREEGESGSEASD